LTASVLEAVIWPAARLVRVLVAAVAPPPMLTVLVGVVPAKPP